MSSPESVKVVLLGEAGVGKTSIIQQFAYHQFDPDCLSSISAQFISKTIDYKGYGPIKFDIWDTAGQEIKDYWHEQIKLNCENDAILALVANKNDLYDEQQVSDDEGQSFADNIDAIFQSTSALSNNGIEKLFENIGKKIIDPDYDYKDSDKKANDDGTIDAEYTEK